MIFINQVINTRSIEDRTAYPYNIPSIYNLNELTFRKSVTFIVGENGSGKSTLVEALSVTSQFNLLIRINELEKKNSQFVIATHSPILLAYPNADIYRISDEGIELVE